MSSYEHSNNALCEIKKENFVNKDQIEQFHHQGFLVVEKFLSKERINNLMLETDEIISKPTIPYAKALRSGYQSNWGVFSDHVGGIASQGATLSALQSDEEALQIATALAGRPVDAIGLSMQIMFGQCGCKQPWHQDHTPGDPKLWWINCVYYLTDMHEDNGSLLVIPGTQNTPLTKKVQDYGPMPGSLRINCPAGSAVFFTNGLLHAVDENRTANTRRGLKVNYVPTGMEFYICHEQRYSRGVRRGDGPVANKTSTTGSYWFV